MRRIVLAAIVGAAILPASANAQYFGRNRVQYGRFDFKIIQTEHFDVYYYDRERQGALDIARMAERSYIRLSKVLAHEFEERKPIILYASHSDFQQTNLSGGGVDESTQGFTDYLRHRNTFPLFGSLAEDEHVLTHEMVHQFQFDIWSRGKTGAGIQGIFSANAPLWFGEGMAEYFSLGPTDSKTAMWLRDGALEGKLPSPSDFLTVFPYQFGHGLVTYIGQRWGDEAIGAVTKNAIGGGLDMALRRVLGLTFDQLVTQWQDAVTKQYLPEITNRDKARAVAKEVLTEKRSDGTWHLAPALSPDGSKVAYFSEKDFFFIDFWLGDVASGKATKRLLSTSFSGNYESFRYLQSSSAFSEDGSMIVLASQRGGKDDLVLVDPSNGKEIRRIPVPLSGASTPTFSPDGKRIVFTGLQGGFSDLYVINVDGTGLERLTNDKHADLHPVWSPDGTTIAFSSDRGPSTDLAKLKWSNLRISLLTLADRRVEVLPNMEEGRNSSPQWSPDGKSIAFVSDRDNVANLFLADLSDREVYQLTNFYTGSQGITPLSPVLSWAKKADKLAFMYFEQGNYDVYALDNPRSLKKAAWRSAHAPGKQVLVQAAPLRPIPVADPADTVKTPTAPEVLTASSVYRTTAGFRRTDSLPPVPDSAKVPGVITIAKMLDSVEITPPDTSDFVYRPYKAKFEPEYVARPTIGYTRDNFGRGVTGSATLVLGDMLSDQQLVFGASLNGRLPETQFLAQYTNLKRRLNWAVSVSQQPIFYPLGASIESGPRQGENTFVTSYRRLVFRDVSAIGYYPFSRFSRIQAGVSLAAINDDVLEIREPYSVTSGAPSAQPFLATRDLPSISYLQPSLAYVYDNSLSAFVGPFIGRRARFEIAQNFDPFGNGWKFTSLTADTRRYDRVVGNVTLATRALFFGRMGRDESQFIFFGGNTELIRGYTTGSFRSNECAGPSDPQSFTGCAAFDELIGSRAAVFNAELRIPLIAGPIGLLPSSGFPGAIEAAVFYDAGVFWESGQQVRLTRKANEVASSVRRPLTSVGLSLRANLLNFVILRLDYARPLQRQNIGGVWTISLGPTF